MAADLEKQIDRLYGVAPEEFVERRDELARSLRRDGDRGAADEVKKLRRPTVAAWTVNQLARREKMRLRSLLTAGERLRKAHEELLGGGSPEALQRAQDDERKAIRELAGAAEALLREAGHPATEATLDRVRETLHAAAVDEELAVRVRAGRLDRETRAAGFGFESLAPASAPQREARSARGQRAARRRDAAARDEARRAEQAARETERREREAARERRRQAEERLRDARRAAKEAERAVKERRRELERAERELAGRWADVERAEAELETAGSSPGVHAGEP